MSIRCLLGIHRLPERPSNTSNFSPCVRCGSPLLEDPMRHRYWYGRHTRSCAYAQWQEPCTCGCDDEEWKRIDAAVDAYYTADTTSPCPHCGSYGHFARDCEREAIAERNRLDDAREESDEARTTTPRRDETRGET